MERLIIITGASRGIGATIAIQANKKFSANTIFLLIARDEQKLADVKNQIMSLSPMNQVILMKIDFSHDLSKDQMTSSIKKNFADNQLNKIKELFIFYNHGTLRLEPIESAEEKKKQEFQINVFSVWTLICAFKEIFPLETIPLQYHINISSLMATLALKNYSTYCTTRSARATLFRCLSLEEPRLRVLNYQPGPVYTDMQRQIYENSEAHFSESYKDLYEQGKLVQPEQTVERLWKILVKNEFENGSAIDFYDSE